MHEWHQQSGGKQASDTVSGGGWKMFSVRASWLATMSTPFFNNTEEWRWQAAGQRRITCHRYHPHLWRQRLCPSQWPVTGSN